MRCYPVTLELICFLAWGVSSLHTNNSGVSPMRDEKKKVLSDRFSRTFSHLD